MLRLTCAVLALSSAAFTQTSVHATKVVALDNKGQAGGGLFNPPDMLGRPDALANSLGNGGFAQLGFNVVIGDGPGADLIVSENPFGSFTTPLESFAEMVFVEVSSDGVTFARVPNAYYGAAQSPGAYGFVNVGSYEGMAGATPINTSATDPLDIVDAGGDAIDLADLANDPLVQSGAVALNAITQVRLVDVRDGIDKDSRGVTIFDPGLGSADIDGISVIHHTGNIDPTGPTVDVVIPKDGAFEISVDDPDGWQDLDPATLHAALWGNPLLFADLLPLMTVTRFNATGFTLKLAGALPQGLLLRVSVSVKDRAGNRSGDTRSRPIN